MKIHVLLAVLLLSLPVVAFGQNQAPVVDLSSAVPGINPASGIRLTELDSDESESSLDVYDRSQALLEEVRLLRGMVEELNYELSQVKQRQMDDYLNIDRRLSGLAEGAAAASSGMRSISQTGEKAASISRIGLEKGLTGDEVTDMKTSYDSASNLLLKKRDIDGAAAAFKQHVADYPSSPYSANAYYWLGEIHLLQGQDELARQSFSVVVEQYAGHSKALDASFKLGKIYHQLGDLERSRELLEMTAQSTGGAAVQAQSYLDNNF
ncbi:MAG: YbgF trimerization domain-containing protein [Porticoccaceae bacterium]|jgi:tol-pal system protein YbgF|tara:strand:+ start:6778 stop:7575 length:798 start_codon:yes stop_codon:yes gene_type:complete